MQFYYDGLGPPTERRYASGVRTDYTYDPLGRLVGIRDERATSDVVAQWRWEVALDGVPRLAELRREGIGPAGSVFQVDFGARLLAENHELTGLDAVAVAPDMATAAANAVVDSYVEKGDTWTRYTLDGRGNWTSLVGVDGTVSTEPTAGDLYEGLGAIMPVYDAAGALLDDGNISITYDSYANPVEVETAAADVEYVRDAFERTVLERDVDTGAVTRYGYDGPDRVLRKSEGGDIDVTIVGQGLDNLLLRLDAASAERVYYHQERLGSVYLLTDGSGFPIEWYSYSGYGDATISDPAGNPLATSSVDNRFGFQGHPFDARTGLVDMRRRFHRPAWGRFVTPDPVGYAAGPNLFAFVGSSPLAFVDPFGLWRTFQQRYYDAWNNAKKKKTPTAALEPSLTEVLAQGEFTDQEEALIKLLMASDRAEKNRITRIRNELEVTEAWEKDTNALKAELNGIAFQPIIAPAPTAALGVVGCARGNEIDCASLVIASAVKIKSSRPRGPPRRGTRPPSGGIRGGGGAGRGGGSGVGSGGSATIRGGGSQPYRIYSTRELLRRADEPGPMHNFPASFDDRIVDSGARVVKKDYFEVPKTGLSNDSVQYTLRGAINGKTGTFELFVRPSVSGNVEVVMHRFFRPDK